ncbi:MAG: RecX family transcriptional regulator, partial [Clostridium sp.]|nr:RecX family transcriptional regulator [Clostridium sp.]
KYTEMFLKEKLRSRGLRKASYELSQKGISKELVAGVSEEINTYDIEEESCRAHGVKKYEQLNKKETDPYKLKNKLFTFLSSKGYDYDLVNSIMGEILTSKKD